MTTHRHDIIVVGAGIAGAATAHYLSERGHRVLILDSVRPAFGASGRNPGFLWLQTKSAGLQMDFALAGRQFAASIADDLGEFGFRACGGLIVYRDERLAPIAEAFVADRCAGGLAVEHVDRAQLLSLCAAFGPKVVGGVYNPLDAYQDTPALVARFVALSLARGAGLRAPAKVSSLLMSGGTCRGVVLDSAEEIGAAHVVLASGLDTVRILEAAGCGMDPWDIYRFEASATAPADLEIEPVICGQALFRFFTPVGVDRTAVEALTRHHLDAGDPPLRFTEQIVRGADGRIRFGCAFTTSPANDQPTVKGQAMASSILPETIPALAGLPLERSWAGIVCQPQDGLPVIDPRPGIEGLSINSGHFFGNLVGAYAGSLLASAVSGDRPAYDLTPFALGRLSTLTRLSNQ